MAVPEKDPYDELVGRILREEQAEQPHHPRELYDGSEKFWLIDSLPRLLFAPFRRFMRKVQE